MTADEPQTSVYRWECSCGKEFERDARAANLPAENNKRIAESCAGAHAFTHEFRGDEFVIERRWSA